MSHKSVWSIFWKEEKEGSDSPPIKKPYVPSHFYLDERHMSKIKSNGKKQDTSIPNLFLSQHPLATSTPMSSTVKTSTIFSNTVLATTSTCASRFRPYHHHIPFTDSGFLHLLHTQNLDLPPFSQPPNKGPSKSTPSPKIKSQSPQTWFTKNPLTLKCVGV